MLKEKSNISPVVPPPPAQPIDQIKTGIAVVPATLTTQEAAAYLNVRPTTLEQWRWSGRGPRFRKIGRLCRYVQLDLDDFLAERVFTSTTEVTASVVPRRTA